VTGSGKDIGQEPERRDHPVEDPLGRAEPLRERLKGVGDQRSTVEIHHVRVEGSRACAIDLDIAYGSPSTDSTNIYLIDAAEVMLADDGGVTLDVSREASLQMDDAPSAGAQSLVSLWQNNLIGLRAERYINWMKRRATAALFISGVTY